MKSLIEKIKQFFNKKTVSSASQNKMKEEELANSIKDLPHILQNFMVYKERWQKISYTQFIAIAKQIEIEIKDENVRNFIDNLNKQIDETNEYSISINECLQQINVGDGSTQRFINESTYSADYIVNMYNNLINTETEKINSIMNATYGLIKKINHLIGLLRELAEILDIKKLPNVEKHFNALAYGTTKIKQQSKKVKICKESMFMLIRTINVSLNRMSMLTRRINREGMKKHYKNKKIK